MVAIISLLALYQFLMTWAQEDESLLLSSSLSRSSLFEFLHTAVVVETTEASIHKDHTTTAPLRLVVGGKQQQQQTSRQHQSPIHPPSLAKQTPGASIHKDRTTTAPLRLAVGGKQQQKQKQQTSRQHQSPIQPPSLAKQTPAVLPQQHDKRGEKDKNNNHMENQFNTTTVVPPPEQQQRPAILFVHFHKSGGSLACSYMMQLSSLTLTDDQFRPVDLNGGSGGRQHLNCNAQHAGPWTDRRLPPPLPTKQHPISHPGMNPRPLL